MGLQSNCTPRLLMPIDFCLAKSGTRMKAVGIESTDSVYKTRQWTGPSTVANVCKSQIIVLIPGEGKCPVKSPLVKQLKIIGTAEQYMFKKGLRVLPLRIFDCCLTSFSESAMSQKTLKPVQRKGDSFTSKKISKAIELTSSSSAASASALQTLQAVQAFSSGQWHPSPDKYPTCIQFSDLVSFMESNESNNHWGYDRIWHGSNDKNKGKIC